MDALELEVELELFELELLELLDVELLELVVLELALLELAPIVASESPQPASMAVPPESSMPSMRRRC